MLLYENIELNEMISIELLDVSWGQANSIYFQFNSDVETRVSYFINDFLRLLRASF